MTLLAINWGNAVATTLMGFGIVFVILCLLVIVITLFGKAMAPKVLVKKKKNEGTEPMTTNAPVAEEYDEVHLSTDECAAIAMALHLFYGDVHDEESRIMTTKKVERRYSPWNSKIYGLNNLVR